MVPEGWETVSLGDVAQVNASSLKTSSAPEQILYVDIASVSTRKIEKIEHLAFSDAPSRARRLVRHGDIIWSCVRPNRRSYSLILDPADSLVVSTGFAVITPTEVPFSFLYHAVTTQDFVEYLTNHASGAAYPAVNAGDFERAKVLLPTAALLERFHEIAEPMLIQQETLQRRNVKLREARDLLLPKLVSGEVDVSDLEIEVPAA
jgi:type I restriction enzyme S subunit